MSYQALELNGNGYASIANASQAGLNMGLSDFMIEALIKANADGPDTDQRITSKQNGGYHIFRLNTSGQLNSRLYDGTNTAVATGTTDLRDGLWHYVCLSVDKSSATGMQLYLAGSTEGSSANPSVLGNLDSTGDFYIGAWFESSQMFYGLLDEIRIWNFGVDVLPEDYATYIAWRAAGRNRFLATSNYDSNSWASYITNNLKGYWKFDGDYTDETANGNDLTAGGTGNTFPGYSLRHKGQKMLLGVG